MMGLLAAERDAVAPLAGVQRAVYPVTGDPPSDTGLAKATLIPPSPGVVLEIIGAEGGEGPVTTGTVGCGGATGVGEGAALAAGPPEPPQPNSSAAQKTKNIPAISRNATLGWIVNCKRKLIPVG